MGIACPSNLLILRLVACKVHNLWKYLGTQAFKEHQVSLRSSVVLMNPASPLDHLDVGANATPVLVDWDLDGHLDLVVPWTYKRLK